MDSIVMVLSLRKMEFSRAREIVEFSILTGVSFCAPFLMGHPQLLVGTLVNAALILAALNLKGYKIAPIVLLPSLAVLGRGLIFGPFTAFLIYTIPFVWLGNFALVYGIKYFHLKKKWNIYFSMIVSILIKVAILYCFASLLISLNILPKIFATSMGILQVYTAIAGGILALSVSKIIKSK